ncbi:MAG: hypothetical protein JNM94_12760 [Phycisphaerae bacterium]|nr:hypothetical protein [Phycisphaerae bacterium]
MAQSLLRPVHVAGLSVAAAVAMTAPAMAGTTPLVISEVRTGQPGADTQEYIEIRGEPGTVLSDVWYVVVGDDDTQLPPAQNGYVEFAVNLTGAVIPASGYLVVAEATFTLAPANVTTTLIFEDNSNVTHLLVSGFSGAVGSDIDANDDGVQDSTPWGAVLSSVAMVSGDDPDGVNANFVYSTNLVGPEGLSNVPGHVYRCEDGTEYRVASSDLSAGDDTVGAANPECGITPDTVKISEIRIDQSGTDNDEYFELTGPGGTSLSDLTYIVIGDGTGQSGTIEAVVSLAGQTMPNDGFFLVTESTFTLGGAIPDLNVGAAGLNFENSDNVTHLLVRGFTGANAQDLDTNNDGILDVTPWTEIVDSVAVVVDPAVPPTTSEFVYSTSVVGPDGGFSPSHVYRCDPNGDWQIGTFDPSIGVDSPGATNAGCPSCGGTESCFVEHASNGCSVLDCCTLVCDADPTCCASGWDAACVSAANANCLSGGAAPSLSINEVRIGQAGTDLNEYVEIAGAPGTSLNGVAYVVLGDGNGSGNGFVESVSLLSGTIPSDGLFVVATSDFALGTPDLVRNSINFEDGDTVTHLLVFNFNGAIGQNLDANNDCALDGTAWASTIDSLTLTAGDGACGFGAATVGPDTAFSPSHAYKCTPSGTWTVGLFDSLANDTPGAANAECPQPSPCGQKGTQDCYTAARTPGCSDADCCNAICVSDPTCCDIAWDADCVSAANLNCFIAPEAPAIELSEMRIDQSGDDNDEYVEVVGPAGTNLNGVSLVVIGDGGATAGSGVIDMAVSLGQSSIPADGFYVVGKETFTLDGVTLDKVIPTGFNLENSDNLTVLLVWQFTGASGDDLDTNDDGVLDATPWATIIDSVAVIETTTVPPETGSEYVYSTTTVGPDGTFAPGHVKFCPTTSTWTIGIFDILTGSDTPGSPNDDCTYSDPCPADITGDGVVDGADLGALLGAWGTPNGDLTGDNVTDGADLGALLGAWGACP